MDGCLDREGANHDHRKPRILRQWAALYGSICNRARCKGFVCITIADRWRDREFGVCVLQDFWGYGIGKHLLQASISWADSNGIKKMTLQVLERNEKAIELYKRFGFEIEGIPKNDKLLSDGNYYNAIMMGRWIE
ncbi:GNAT family N-acetyltransferase [Brevibacillus humidisoli]|nr:GNAT family N-acetyltransferase [Brevibacillus humidisoli]UFJ43312.1 GNAT family N-acetyltransferase [Brevibacillus humidisoli]